MLEGKAPARIVQMLIVAGLLLAGAGCYRHTYTVGAGAPAGPLVYDHWHHHWLWGIINPDRQVRSRPSARRATPRSTTRCRS